MREAIIQSVQNLRANKLRSFLTMFGILWGMISVVVLSATGEGFRRGNDKVLRELGKNIGIVWGGRTSLQAGGERAGRQILLTLDDARAIAEESSMIEVVSPEIERAAVKVKSAFNAATARVTGIEPQYQRGASSPSSCSWPTARFRRRPRRRLPRRVLRRDRRQLSRTDQPAGGRRARRPTRPRHGGRCDGDRRVAAREERQPGVHARVSSRLRQQGVEPSRSRRRRAVRRHARGKTADRRPVPGRGRRAAAAARRL